MNNIGWSLHDAGRWTEALEVFDETVALHRDDFDQHLIARWSAARVLRSLGRFGQALKVQLELLEQLNAREKTDAYVHEEIAENLLALENPAQAAPHFERAHEFLSKDPWFCESEPVRLERLRQRSSPESAPEEVLR